MIYSILYGERGSSQLYSIIIISLHCSSMSILQTYMYMRLNVNEKLYDVYVIGLPVEKRVQIIGPRKYPSDQKKTNRVGLRKTEGRENLVYMHCGS